VSVIKPHASVYRTTHRGWCFQTSLGYKKCNYETRKQAEMDALLLMQCIEESPATLRHAEESTSGG